jgi:hypothetical protein
VAARYEDFIADFITDYQKNRIDSFAPNQKSHSLAICSA